MMAVTPKCNSKIENNDEDVFFFYIFLLTI